MGAVSRRGVLGAGALPLLSAFAPAATSEALTIGSDGWFYDAWVRRAAAIVAAKALPITDKAEEGAWEAAMERVAEIERAICATPARSAGGTLVKLRLWWAMEGDIELDLLGEDDGFTSLGVLQSAARDLARLAAQVRS